MATKTISLNDFASEIKGFSEATLKDQRKAVTDGMLRSIPDLVVASPVDLGEYANSWLFDETEKAAILGNMAPHAGIIENGARPFTPPIGPLLAWAKRVTGDASQPPNYSSQVWRLAKGVQQKIARQGIAPKRILEQAIPGIIANVRKSLNELDKA